MPTSSASFSGRTLGEFFVSESVDENEGEHKTSEVIVAENISDDEKNVKYEILQIFEKVSIYLNIIAKSNVSYLTFIKENGSVFIKVNDKNDDILNEFNKIKNDILEFLKEVNKIKRLIALQKLTSRKNSKESNFTHIKQKIKNLNDRILFLLEEINTKKDLLENCLENVKALYTLLDEEKTKYIKLRNSNFHLSDEFKNAISTFVVQTFGLMSLLGTLLIFAGFHVISQKQITMFNLQLKPMQNHFTDFFKQIFTQTSVNLYPTQYAANLQIEQTNLFERFYTPLDDIQNETSALFLTLMHFLKCLNDNKMVSENTNTLENFANTKKLMQFYMHMSQQYLLLMTTLKIQDKQFIDQKMQMYFGTGMNLFTLLLPSSTLSFNLLRNFWNKNAGILQPDDNQKLLQFLMQKRTSNNEQSSNDLSNLPNLQNLLNRNLLVGTERNKGVEIEEMNTIIQSLDKLNIEENNNSKKSLVNVFLRNHHPDLNVQQMTLYINKKKQNLNFFKQDEYTIETKLINQMLRLDPIFINRMHQKIYNKNYLLSGNVENESLTAQALVHMKNTTNKKEEITEDILVDVFTAFLSKLSEN